VAELVDAHDSKSCSSLSAGSIPAAGTRAKSPFSEKKTGFFVFMGDEVVPRFKPGVRQHGFDMHVVS
jgi:hypothetical protein